MSFFISSPTLERNICPNHLFNIGCWLPVSSNAGYIVFAAFFGFTSGGVVSLFPACFGQLTSHPSEIGTYMGQAMAIMSIAGLTGSPIAGQLVTKYGWDEAVYYSGATTMAGAFVILTAKLVHNRKFGAIV